MPFKAPVDVTFRRMRFSFEADGLPKYWYAQSPSLTHFFNALSAVFPDGERYFIDSVRAFEDVVSDPELAAKVRAFTRDIRRYELRRRSRPTGGPAHPLGALKHAKLPQRE